MVDSVSELRSGSIAQDKQEAVYRRLRWHTVASGLGGAAMSTLSAFLVAFALLDIERQVWARRLYTTVYGTSAVIFASPLGHDVLPERVARWALVSACICIAGFSFYTSELMRAPQAVRITALTVVGTGLGASLLFSALVLMRLVADWRTGTISSGDVTGLANPQQLLALAICALAEGGYFGLAIGYLDRNAAVGANGLLLGAIRLPHEAPQVVVPSAALLGGICGTVVERARQQRDRAYVGAVEMRVLAETVGYSGGEVAEGEQDSLLADASACY